MHPGRCVDLQYCICLIISLFYDGVFIVLIDFRLFVWFILGIVLYRAPDGYPAYGCIKTECICNSVFDVQAYFSVFKQIIINAGGTRTPAVGKKSTSLLESALCLAVFLRIRCAEWERFWLLGTCRQLAVAASYQRTSHAKNTLRMTSFCAPTIAPFLQPSALLHLESKVTLLHALRSHAPPLQLNVPAGKWQPEVTVMLLCSVLSNSIMPVETQAWNKKKISKLFIIFFWFNHSLFSLTLKWAPVITQALPSDVQNLAPKGISCPHFVW